MTPISKSPRQLGYRWPAEWEPHAASWLAWPHNADTWPGRLAEATAEFVQLARTLARYETVHLLAGGYIEHARSQLGSHRNIELWDIPTNDAWIRDYGPTFLKRGQETLLVDWQFNAWGGKYPPYDLDDGVTSRIAKQFGLPCLSAPFILEGGSIEGNGQGCLLSTRNCLLHPNRNPEMPQDNIEFVLQEFLGLEQIVWLDGEIAGDDTDGHIDQLARFVSPATVAAASEHQRGDVNYAPLATLGAQLAGAAIGNQSVRFVELPMPSPIYHGRQRLPASYANFYVANDVVLVPQFGDNHDETAKCALGDCFADRLVMGLPCRELVRGLGGFHCLSVAQPL